MRGFTSQYEVQYTAVADLPYATEEGEVERAIVVEATDTLPTPLGTPAPSDRTLQAEHAGTSDDPTSAVEASAKLPPEPTPLLLRNFDHASTYLFLKL